MFLAGVLMRARIDDTNLPKSLATQLRSGSRFKDCEYVKRYDLLRDVCQLCSELDVAVRP
jgi:hypothetical protein